MIIVVLCIVIVCLRRSSRKKGLEDGKVTYSMSKLNTDVTGDNNPSNDITEANTVDYDTINSGAYYNIHTIPYSKTSEEEYTSKLNTDVTMDNNPSYDVTKANREDYDTVNPGAYYNVHTKPYSKKSEEEYYVQPYEPTHGQHIDVDGYIKIHPPTGQSHDTKGIHSHFTANINSPVQDEYELINQPYS